MFHCCFGSFIFLSLGAALGLTFATSASTREIWFESQEQHCGLIDLNLHWWRIPLFLLCSASVLGQCRFPLAQYWRGLMVQLCAYEVQYQTFNNLDPHYVQDNLDTSASNTLVAAAGAISTCVLSSIANKVIGCSNTEDNYSQDILYKLSILHNNKWKSF